MLSEFRDYILELPAQRKTWDSSKALIRSSRLKLLKQLIGFKLLERAITLNALQDF